MTESKKRLISVLMSIYNEPEQWLCESIESILNQTYTDFEFIIINDNPEREVNRKVLNRYQGKDKRIITIHNEENIGLTKSLNKGLKIAKGEFIARMDGDDISLPRRFEKQVIHLFNNPDIAVCGTQIKIIGNWINFKKLIFPLEHDRIAHELLLNSCFAHPTVMIRREVLKRNNIEYDESFQQTQDYKLWVDLIGLGKFSNIKERLLLYRTSQNQISLKKKEQQIANAKRCRLICLKKLYPNIEFLNSTDLFSVNPAQIKELTADKLKNSSLLVLYWLSLKEYSLKTTITFIESGDWRYFNSMQVLAYFKRFFKGSQPLI